MGVGVVTAPPSVVDEVGGAPVVDELGGLVIGGVVTPVVAPGADVLPLIPTQT